MDNLEENNVSEATVSPNDKMVLYFLNACGFICEDIKELDGIIVSRETLLSDTLYDKLKKDIPKLKSVLSSTTFTSMQKDADKSQKWPLINLIRQILRKYDYQLNPKRVCDGYTKDGIKKYKRFFEVRQGVHPLQTPSL